VQQLKGTEWQKELDTLLLFSTGTYNDYLARKDSVSPLNEKQLYKLKQLSLVSLSATSRVIPYDVLLKQLDIQNLRNLEDLLIDSFYQGLCRGKLDQRGKVVEIYECMGRDVPFDKIDVLTSTLKAWVGQSKEVISSLEKNSANAIHTFESYKKQKEEYDAKVESIKKEMKATMEVPEGMMGMGLDYGKKKKN